MMSGRTIYCYTLAAHHKLIMGKCFTGGSTHVQHSGKDHPKR